MFAHFSGVLLLCTFLFVFFIIRYDTLYHTFLPLPRALAILNSVKSTRLNVAHGEHAILLRDFEAKYDDMVEYLRLIDQVIGDLQIDEAIAEKVATQIEESLFSFFKKDAMKSEWQSWKFTGRLQNGRWQNGRLQVVFSSMPAWLYFLYPLTFPHNIPLNLFIFVNL